MSVELMYLTLEDLLEIEDHKWNYCPNLTKDKTKDSCSQTSNTFKY